MKTLLLSIAILTLFAFKNSTENENYKKISQTEATNIITQHPGKKLVETKCYVCHSPSASEQEGRIAPPMAAIKARYSKEGYDKTEFIKHIQEFVANPTEGKALMYGAVKRFGVMPKQQFAKEDIKQIAEYVYDYKIAEPSWFAKHWKEQGMGRSN
jgi:cytochrome c553